MDGHYRTLYREQFGDGSIETHCADGIVMADGNCHPHQAYDIAARMAYGGLDLRTAAEQAVLERLTKARGRGGVIALDARGNVAAVFNTPGMHRGIVGRDHELSVKID